LISIVGFPATQILIRLPGVLMLWVCFSRILLCFGIWDRTVCLWPYPHQTWQWALSRSRESGGSFMNCSKEA
jgi:hypothetical protein